MLQAALLPNRGILALKGVDRAAFLQGLVTNDVNKITAGKGIYAAFLSPQGKFQYDLFMGTPKQNLAEIPSEIPWLLDCDCSEGAERAGHLLRQLSLYKLRSQVVLENFTGQWSVIALWKVQDLKLDELVAELNNELSFKGAAAFEDPRLKELGLRVIAPSELVPSIYKISGAAPASFEDYDLHRLQKGIPDGSRDIIANRGIPLECGLDELNAIDWHKGCYMGQELTARTRYRGLVRKRLIPVKIEGETPAFQTPVLQAGQEVGEMRSSAKVWGLAMLRLESLSKVLPFYASGSLLVPHIPGWMRLPAVEVEG